MTGGRHRNTAHLVAPTLDEARRQWIEVFGRDRADLGPAHAATSAGEDIERYGPQAQPPRPEVGTYDEVPSSDTSRPFRPPPPGTYESGRHGAGGVGR